MGKHLMDVRALLFWNYTTLDDDLSFLLQHVFVAQGGLTWRLAVDLLDKMNNPDNHHHYSEVDDDDLEVIPEWIAQEKNTFISRK